MKSPEIVVVGSLNNDLVAYLTRFPAAGETVTGDDFKTFCGGKGANQAYAAGKLGAHVAMVGQIGNDTAGDAQIANLQAAGVQTSWIVRDPSAPTGTAIITVQRGENRIIVIPGANGSFTPDKLTPAHDLLRNAKYVLLQLEIPMETVEAAARVAKSGSARVILDPAPAAALGSDLLRHVEYLTPNAAELQAITALPAACESDAETAHAAGLLLSRGVGTVIAKRGQQGASIYGEVQPVHVRAFAVQPVDTTAAGDCFNAAFAVALARGNSDGEAARFACAAAAISVTRAGAQASMPSLEEVNSFLKSK